MRSERGIAVDDDVLVRAAANCAGAYRTWAEALGKPAQVWDDLSCGDLELPVSMPPSRCTSAWVTGPSPSSPSGSAREADENTHSSVSGASTRASQVPTPADSLESGHHGR